MPGTPDTLRMSEPLQSLMQASTRLRPKRAGQLQSTPPCRIRQRGYRPHFFGTKVSTRLGQMGQARLTGVRLTSYGPRLYRTLYPRLDVLVDVEDVVGVVVRLDLGQTVIVVTVGGANSFLALFHHEINIRTSHGIGM